MLKGKPLNFTSTLGIVSPSSCEDKDKINSYINKFKSLGFNLKLGNYLYDKEGFFAGTDIHRSQDITNMFLDDSIDGIICLRGGYGSIRTLRYIDQNIIINNPKFFCGYSDITILLNYFTSLGLITFHGPMINSNFDDKVTCKSFIDLSFSNNNKYTYDLNEYPYISYINPAPFSGKIIGGNLSVICSAIGTPYEIDTSNSILLLEDVNQRPYTIDRMITQLIISGILSKCNGIIVGYLSNEPSYNTSISKNILEKTITDALDVLEIPIVLGFPFGHNYPNLMLPIGCDASFSNDSRLLIFSDNFLL